MLYADTFELGPVAKAATFETPKTQDISDKIVRQSQFQVASEEARPA